MEKLTSVDYWDTIYGKNSSIHKKAGESPSRLKRFLKHLTRDYANGFLLHETLLAHFVPKGGDIKTLEIGCAPGGNLLYFRNNFGHQIWGVEYAPNGATATRQRFAAEGVDPSHVIEADLFDEEFQRAHEGGYDLVYSEGLIEHFDDPAQVVRDHLRLLKNGGYLYILIPNLAGAVNRGLANFFDKNAFVIHNLKIMNSASFAALFPDSELETLFCGYVGIFHLGLFAPDTPAKERLLRLLSYIQRILNLIFRVLFATTPKEWQATSPYLVYIGRKR